MREKARELGILIGPTEYSDCICPTCGMYQAFCAGGQKGHWSEKDKPCQRMGEPAEETFNRYQQLTTWKETEVAKTLAKQIAQANSQAEFEKEFQRKGL